MIFFFYFLHKAIGKTVDFFLECRYNREADATVAQSVEQLIRNQQAAGSSPASSSKIKQPILSVVLFFIHILDGLEGGSRFSREKRFALRNINHSFPYGKGRC